MRRNFLGNKKAQIGNLQGIVLSLVVIGIVLGIGFLVLSEFKDTINTDVGSVVNETLTTVGDSVTSPEIVATSTTNCFGNFVPTTVTNATSATLITSGNYTYNSNGTIWYTGIEDFEGFNNSNWNVTYTYTYGDEACGSIEDTETAMNTIPTWFTIIVILAIVGILLAIVFKVLPNASGSGSFGGKGSGGTIAEV